MTCFGCGPTNERGLQPLHSFPHRRRRDHDLTPGLNTTTAWGFLNGGIICTILDCHSAAAVLWEADKRGWGPGPGRRFCLCHRRTRRAGTYGRAH